MPNDLCGSRSVTLAAWQLSDLVPELEMEGHVA
jgi:hypothetical protein